MPKQSISNIEEGPESNVFKLLRGFGHHAKIPVFDNNPDNFANWKNRLHHYLLMLDLYKHLNGADAISESQDKDLYMAIASCVIDTTLNLICTQAFGQGREAYRLINQKFTGNADARETATMMEISECKQGESEGLSKYLDRFEQIKNRIDEYKIVSKSTFLVVLCLNGLNSKYATFKSIISTGKMPDWVTFKERIESHAAIMSLNNTKTNKVLNISDSYIPKIIKTRGTHFKKKFIKFGNKCLNCYGRNHTTKNCNSDKFCDHCKNASHNTNDCRLKHKSYLNASQGTATLPGNSRGGDTQNRGRSQNRGRGKRNNFVALGRGRGKFKNSVNSFQNNDNDFENSQNSPSNVEKYAFLANPQYSRLINNNDQNIIGNSQNSPNQNFNNVSSIQEHNATNFNNLFL